ncbi:hypothetical protein L208DRAFT_1316269 [Tricholoma matsutake]|nr:hypothetical protein L208DRAFT_1316269 [Tricholoma matsutake 945]
MLTVQEWRHIKSVKRAGWGHNPAGIAGTRPGELAVPCRACPHPGVNLPKGWERADAATVGLYSLILSQDANFCLKGHMRSSDAVDPSLGPGFAYFVKSNEYLAHLSKYIDQDEVLTCCLCHCVGFAALWLTNSKKSKGLHATGVGSVSCAWHEMFRANGTGDLQKGER